MARCPAIPRAARARRPTDAVTVAASSMSIEAARPYMKTSRLVPRAKPAWRPAAPP
jgi:hypothetical protein